MGSGMIEEYQLQLVSIFAGQIGPQQVATHNTTMIFFLVLSSAMWAIMQATQTRLGHHLGNRDLPGVFRVRRIAFTVAGLWGGCVQIIFIVLRKDLGRLYSANPEIWQLAEEISMVV